MKFVVENEKLAAGLAQVKGCVPNRSTIPILAHILADAKANNTLTLRASSLDREAEVTIPAQVDAVGSVSLPGEIFSGIARHLTKGGQATLELKDDAAKLVSGRSRYSMATLPAADFPARKEFTVQPTVFTMAGSALTTMLAKTVFGCRPDDARAFCQGVQLFVEGQKLIAVGTDGCRIVTHSVDLPKGAAAAPHLTLPEPFVRLILSVVGADSELTISGSASMVEIQAPNLRLAASLIDAKRMLDYSKLIPQTPPRVTFRPYALKEALDRAAVVWLGGSDTNKTPFVDLVITSGAIEIKASARGTAEATEAVEVEGYTGPDASITLSKQYLSECLAAWPETASVGLSQDATRKPVMLASDSHPEMMQLIAPSVF